MLYAKNYRYGYFMQKIQVTPNSQLNKKKLSFMDQAVLDLSNFDDDTVVSLKELKNELAEWIEKADR